MRLIVNELISFIGEIDFIISKLIIRVHKLFHMFTLKKGATDANSKISFQETQLNNYSKICRFYPKH